jgi:glycosyltransferase involved in cell wall biosynthesis
VSRSLSVALVISAQGWRGSGASFAKVAQGLLARGHRVHFITAGERLTQRLVALGLPTTLLDLRKTGLREIGAVRRLFAAHDVDVAMVDTPRDLRLSVLASAFRKTKVVYRYNLNYMAARTDLGDRLYLGAAAGLAYQSAYIQADAERQAPFLRGKRSWRIPNGYDADALRPDPAFGPALRARYGIPETAGVVVTGSKLVANKNHRVVFEALARLQAAGQEVHYVCCGDGGEEARLRALATELRVPATFTGFLEPHEMPAVLGGADVVAHPADTEIFPNVIAESLLLERAVVASDAGGIPEVTGPDGATARLVPYNDVAAWADRIGTLLKDPAARQRLGVAGRARIVAEYPIARMQEGYVRMFEELAS